MKRFASLCLFVVTACASDAVDLSNLRCTPSPLSVAGPGPYNVSCDVDFDGSPGDVRWSAYSGAGYFSTGTDSLSASGRSLGSYHFSMSNATAPGPGMLTVAFSAEHVEGLDGPPGDSIMIYIEVVP